MILLFIASFLSSSALGMVLTILLMAFWMDAKRGLNSSVVYGGSAASPRTRRRWASFNLNVDVLRRTL